MKKITALLLSIVLVGGAIIVAQACGCNDCTVRCTAHYHQNIPLIGSRWPCVEGYQKAISDTSGHSFNVKVEIYQGATYLTRGTGTNTASCSIEVSSATGTAKAIGTGSCSQNDATLRQSISEDSVW